MIVRSVNVNDLSRFDFFNDAKDTANWLRLMGRIDEAKKLEAAGGVKPYRNDSIIRHLSPATLAAISVELEVADRSPTEDAFLDDVNAALVANVGEQDADELRLWWINDV